MDDSIILPPDNMKIKRVSDKKIRIKYDLPIYFHINDKSTFLGYQKIGITLRLASIVERNSYRISGYNIKNAPEVYICSRPFIKFFSKISSIYGLKSNNNNIDMIKFPYYHVFEDKETCFIIPKIINLQGDGMKELVRKWKINTLLKDNPSIE